MYYGTMCRKCGAAYYGIWKSVAKHKIGKRYRYIRCENPECRHKPPEPDDVMKIPLIELPYRPKKNRLF